MSAGDWHQPCPVHGYGPCMCRTGAALSMGDFASSLGRQMFEPSPCPDCGQIKCECDSARAEITLGEERALRADAARLDWLQREGDSTLVLIVRRWTDGLWDVQAPGQRWYASDCSSLREAVDAAMREALPAPPVPGAVADVTDAAARAQHAAAPQEGNADV